MAELGYALLSESRPGNGVQVRLLLRLLNMYFNPLDDARSTLPEDHIICAFLEGVMAIVRPTHRWYHAMLVTDVFHRAVRFHTERWVYGMYERDALALDPVFIAASPVRALCWQRVGKRTATSFSLPWDNNVDDYVIRGEAFLVEVGDPDSIRAFANELERRWADAYVEDELKKHRAAKRKAAERTGV